MTNQEIFNGLSAIEEAMFYRYSGGANREGISFADAEKMHEKIRALMLEWHRLTGCKLEEKPQNKIVVEVSGGMCTAVYCSEPASVEVLDYDNLKAGDEYAEEIEQYLNENKSSFVNCW